MWAVSLKGEVVGTLTREIIGSTISFQWRNPHVDFGCSFLSSFHNDVDFSTDFRAVLPVQFAIAGTVFNSLLEPDTGSALAFSQAKL